MLSFPDRGIGRIFTADLERALIRTNGQPVGLIAELVDMTRGSGAYTAHFYMRPFLPFTGRTYFPMNAVLRCNVQQAEELRKTRTQPRILGIQYAVVAKIASVSRAPVPVISMEDDTPTAEGVCVDFLRLESAVTK
jgi:hypothetical protein